jgi:hypothetical protein
MGTGDVNVLAGWIGLLCGIITGSYLGLFFYKDDWAGGYSSFRRRMLRLGHISFFGLGFVNIMYGLTTRAVDISVALPGLTAASFIVGAVTMPLCCYLTAWRKRFRHFFPIPVISVALGVILVLLAWLSS